MKLTIIIYLAAMIILDFLYLNYDSDADSFDTFYTVCDIIAQIFILLWVLNLSEICL